MSTPNPHPRLSELLEEAVADGVSPAASAAVIVDGQWLHRSAHGAIPRGAATPDTRFDVASVTKVIATTAAAAVLVGRGAIELDAPVARWLPRFAAGGKERVTVRHLLGHASGLPAFEAMFLRAREDRVARAIYPGLGAPSGARAAAFDHARERVVDAALTTPLVRPPGTRVYSDLGFIALGELVAAASGEPLDAFCAREVFAALGASDTRFHDLRRPILDPAGVAPTGRTRPREPAPGQEALYDVHEQDPEVRPGEVDDDNAFAMGGVAGHAGVFSTASDVARLGWAFALEVGGAERFTPRGLMAEFARPDPGVEGPVRGLGFDRAAPTGSSAGDRFGRAGPHGAIGHLGFTGCSLWIDLDRRAVAVLLTNRVAYGRAHVEPIRALRPRFHDVVAAIVDGLPSAPSST